MKLVKTINFFYIDMKTNVINIKRNLTLIVLIILLVIISNFCVKLILNGIDIYRNNSVIKTYEEADKLNTINDKSNIKKNNKDIPVSNIENKEILSNRNSNVLYSDNSKLANILINKTSINNKVADVLSNKEYKYLLNNTSNDTTNNIIDVKYISQKEYPTGCESVSTVMLLNYYGIDITVDDFINKYLKKDCINHINGKLYASSPNEAFIGNPYSKEGSFGCYNNVIYEACLKVLKDYNMQDKFIVVKLNNINLDELADKYINNNIPLAIWASINMKPLYNGVTWNLYDDSKFTWKANEHCLVLVGQDNNYYYFNDPLIANDNIYSNNSNIRYLKNVVNDRYNTLNKQAIAIIKSN